MGSELKIALLFPGQGAQYPGMGKDFFDGFVEAKEVFEEADDLLKRNLSKVIFNEDAETLAITKNSQAGIYVVSVAILRVIQKLFPNVVPHVCAGLSLGEYTALTASKYVSFADCLSLVNYRAQFMSEACERNKGTMAVVIGLNEEIVQDIVKEVNLPHELWIANLNAPGQIVISGTVSAVDKASIKAKEKGAKQVIPLQVQGAFHSGMMQEAEDRLAPFIEKASLATSDIALVMNVPGDYIKEVPLIKRNLIKQVTHSVRWEKGIQAIDRHGVDLYIEVGCGNTLAGLNKRIGVQSQTLTIQKVPNLALLEKAFSMPSIKD